MNKIENNQLSLKQILEFRMEKLNNIRSNGINPYPNKFDKKHRISEIINKPEKFKNIQTAGRIVSLRKMGKSCFMHIQEDVNKVQIYVKKDLLKNGLYDDLIRNLDIGDIVGVKGKLFYTKTNELSIKSNLIILLSKNLHPLPNIKEKDGGVEFNIKSWLRNEAINAVGLEIRTMKKKAYEYSKKELMNMIEAEENKIIKKGGMKAVRIAALSAIGLPFLGFL